MRSERRCAHCKGALPEEAKHFPFCSARCKDIDLGRWFQGEFRVSRPASVGEILSAQDDEPDRGHEPP